jgi:AmiR/NasT family two-component response regulator
MVSDALFAEDGTLGALTLCAEKPHAFGRQSIAVATALVAHAAVAYRVTRQQNTIDNLRIALATSRMIGTAIGILKARNDISADEAFDLLRWSSQRKHRKLRDIAEEVVETGRLP